jgi:hypothetical protein
MRCRSAWAERVGRARDLLQRDVRLPHELLDAELATRIAKSERRRGSPLIVEGEPVVAPSGGVVQLVAQSPEKVARRARLFDLARRQEPALARLAKARHLVAHARDPQRRL